MSNKTNNGMNAKYLIDDAYLYFQYWIEKYITSKNDSKFYFFEIMWSEDFLNFEFIFNPKHERYDNDVEKLQNIDKYEFMELMFKDVVIKAYIDGDCKVKYYQFGDLDENFEDYEKTLDNISDGHEFNQ